MKLLKIIFSFHCLSFHCRSPWGGSWADGRSTESFPLSLRTIACRHCHLLQVLTVVPSNLQDITCFCCKTQMRDLCICWITKFKIGTFFLDAGFRVRVFVKSLPKFLLLFLFYYFFVWQGHCKASLPGRRFSSGQLLLITLTNYNISVIPLKPKPPIGNNFYW